ncbi:U-box domain-containing protein 4 isoform X1 [Elaeis guineensis]|uniref:RING-type E3 ubiquitin transferase n=2 Tax=Elaeis guineensis var. tenera TaxID=51953 RepID=A0A6I9SGK9_ELAGV|nr:U-box domain-containing protein 4 isoform X1 [Elaeis guineensis]XP_029116466.1 U-box domain-containing protein 4 isoform X1 [Elaeis guineensis]
MKKRDVHGMQIDGVMEISLLKTLLSSIARFDLLSSSNSIKSELVQRYFQKIDEILELLKPVLDQVVASEISSDGKLIKLVEELDGVVNEARERIGSWHPIMSKVYFVLQIESIITNIQKYAIEVCQLLNSLLPSEIVTSTSTSIEKTQHMHYEQISDVIKETIRDQKEKTIPRPEQLNKISNFLSLSSNQELLMEAVALEKLKVKVGHGENQVEQIDQMIALVTHMHECLVKIKQVHSINGVPIPADFCCPLSLELMSDPVIVASGQTYERAFIRKWLDQGFNVCPKTRQTLGHTNLIPNYTVKALIANWCESNDIKLPDPIKSMNMNLPSSFLSPIDSSGNDCHVPHSGHSPRASHPRSPESNRSMVSSHKDSHSSNGVLKESYLHEKPLSSQHSSIPVESSLQIANGCDANVARLSSSMGEIHVDSGGQTANEAKQDSQASMVDEQLQGHNRSVSASSAVSSNDYLQGTGDANVVSRVSSDLTHYSSDASGEVTRETPVSSTPQREPEFPQRLGEARSRSQNISRRPSVPRIITSSSMDSRPDLSGVETQVRKLIGDLKSDSVDVQRSATEELRLLAKHNMENRIVIANCGAISSLVDLLRSTDPKTQENAVTALLNLSINDNNKTAIANAGAIDPLIHVLETGNPEARENSAATLFSLSVIEESKVRIGRSGAIKPLVELLGNGTPRGKKDAATALFNLSIFHEHKGRIVQAGAVKHLVELMDPAAGMVDKAVAVLANLATIPEGRAAIGHSGGIPVLVEVVELGSARGKENAAAALLQLCTNSNRFCTQVLQEGAVPPLVALSQSGTPRAKEKAQALLSYFRNQRHGKAGRG